MEYSLVIGASSGIGLELAKLFARDNINLIITARSKDKLESLKSELESQYKITVKVIVKDLSLPKSAEEIFQETETQNLKIKYLVNNAGIGDHREFAKSNLNKQ